MGFTVPAVHYSALATVPPELTSSISQHSIQHAGSVRFKLNQIFKKLLSNDTHNEHIITTEIDKRIQLPETTLRLSETIEKRNDTSTVVKNPNNNNRSTRISTGQEPPRSISSGIEPLERLPFTEPYFSTTPKNEKLPLELSTYHKHCIHQQKYIDQKQYHHVLPSTKQTNSSVKENHSNQTNYRVHHLTDPQRQIKFNNKKANSTTTLPVTASIENRIGLHYASRKNTITTNHGIRSSYPQQQIQHLRRLHSKSKIRPISSEIKTSQKQSSSPSSISTSIAHRIELLKAAMHNHQLEVNHLKSEKTSPIQSSTPLLIDTINKQTQTNDNQLKSSEIHHIHHHHIHSSSFLSVEWRTYLSIVGTFFLIFFLLIQFITISF